MSISVARPQLIHIPKVLSVALRMACCAAALYALCISAPAIYSANPAIRAYREQNAILLTGHKEFLSHVRQQHIALLAKANKLEDSRARMVFLQDEIERAENELEGIEQQSTFSQSVFDDHDTVFNRIRGDKVLASHRQQLQDDELYVELARQHVADLTHAAQLCSAP